MSALLETNVHMTNKMTNHTAAEQQIQEPPVPPHSTWGSVSFVEAP